MTPTIHITNFASPQLHKGRVFSIMMWTPSWAARTGVVSCLQPSPENLRAYKDHRLSIEDYRDRFESHMKDMEVLDCLRPGKLCVPADHRRNIEGIIVADGDTLCCTCSRAEAKAGRCHRAWIAPYLVKAGWNVILDGEVMR